MTKNILVTNYNGDIIGATYPKRARGLIKSGRAVQIDEGTIQLSDAVGADAFSIKNYMEDKTMANVIAVKSGKEEAEKTKVLIEALKQKNIKSYIESTFGDSVIYMA